MVAQPMAIDFGALEREIFKEIEIQRRREHLHDTKALAHLRETATPFVEYLRYRLIEVAKLDSEPIKHNDCFAHTVFVLTASKGNFENYSKVVSFGL
jgi:hypothetical protein